MIRKTLTALAITGALITTATPADARPVPDEPRYHGPCVACKFAGAKTSGSVKR